ncbi:MAG: DUF4259 domain-containing protein, partial [Candidatus Eremiobacterota bacterium]
AEVVAAGAGRPGEPLPDEAAAWLKTNRQLDFASLLPLARAQVARVVGSDSELRELWEENADDFPAWHAAVSDLLKRLE